MPLKKRIGAALLVAAGLAIGACSSAANQKAPAAPASLTVETVTDGLRHPWGLAFLPDGSMLVTERDGVVQHVGADGAKTPVSGGPPSVFHEGQSGWLDIALDPDFGDNGLVYVSFAERSEASSHLALYRARYSNQGFTDGRVIFRGSRRANASHPGGRMVFLPDETLLVFVGVADAQRAVSQSLDTYLGKIVRIDREGRAPGDNPFVNTAGALPEIYSYGHRNAMGLVRDSETGAIWEHENGPQGGDELNLIRAGANYGWPLVTFGREYSGGEITSERSRPGMEDPRTQWTPSIAPSGMAVYRGDAFPAWDGKLLIGFLLGRQVRLVDVSDDGEPVQETLALGTNARIRDVRVGPDGLVYLLTDEDNGQVLRVRPGA